MLSVLANAAPSARRIAIGFAKSLAWFVYLGGIAYAAVKYVEYMQ